MKTIRSNRTARALVKRNVHKTDFEEWLLARQCGVWMRRHAYISAIRLAAKRGLIEAQSLSVGQRRALDRQPLDTLARYIPAVLGLAEVTP